MDIVNKTPSVVDIRRFPQREDERKKAKKKYPQSTKSFYDELQKAFDKLDEEDNVIDITPKQELNPPPRDDSWLYQSLLEDR